MITRSLLRLYPTAWRARYGDELAAVLEDLRPTPLSLLDVLLGALDAHLHADLLPGRVLSMTSRLRSAAIAVFCGFAVFVLAYSGWGRLTDPRPPFTAAAQAHPDVLVAWDAAQVAATVAGLAVLVGGMPILLAALINAWRGGRRDILALFAMPVAGVAVCGLLLVAAEAVAPPIPAGQQVRPVTGAFAILGFFFVLATFATFAAGTASVAIAVSRSAIGARMLRFAVWPAAAAVAGMAATLLATLLWALFLWRDEPHMYSGFLGDCVSTQCYGPIGDIGVGGVALVGGLMAIGVVVGACALRRAFSAGTTAEVAA